MTTRNAKGLVIEQACELLSILASDRRMHGMGSFGYFAIGGYGGEVKDLAIAAHVEAGSRYDAAGIGVPYHEEYAEAEAALRCKLATSRRRGA
jgi:hypothetical protein